MTLIQSIDNVVSWISENICSQITLKCPDDDRNDIKNPLEYVHPAAFPLYVPGKDRLPPSVSAPVPSVCVQIMEGNDNLQEGRRQLQLRLCLSCWNPGLHGAEVFHARPDASKTGGYSYYRSTGETAETYTRNMEGWRDSVNFADIVLREIENAEFIAGHRLMKESGIKYGPFVEDGNIWDYYPFWYNWISFTLEAGISATTPKQYEDFL